MTIEQTRQLIDILIEEGVVFDTGLSDAEIRQIEEKFAFQFPPDLKLLLHTALPVSNDFAEWRSALTSPDGYEVVLSRLEWPWEGMLFDMENNDFWIKDWGPKPTAKEEQIHIARQFYNTYPKLIPIYSHRYIPCTPLEAGNPVFSVYQMDIIYYGYNLACYLAGEFSFVLPDNFKIPDEPRPISFWGPWVDQ